MNFPAISLSILCYLCLQSYLTAQDLDIDGSARITTMAPATESAQTVGREPDGTLSIITNSPTYAVGDFAQGGVVFWVNATGEHGRVASLYNVANVPWSRNNREIGNSARSEMNGAGNSVAIVANARDSISAAGQCLDLSYAGYDDWYLPARGELNLMYLQYEVINATSIENGGEAFDEASYWSSTESDVDPSEACNQNFFGSGNQHRDDKYSSFHFRAIRAF